MGPDQLMASLHRHVQALLDSAFNAYQAYSEVIMRKPEIFRMACLRDVRKLFGSPSPNPFYTGFGNHITDALSYQRAQLPHLNH